MPQTVTTFKFQYLIQILHKFYSSKYTHKILCLIKLKNNIKERMNVK